MRTVIRALLLTASATLMCSALAPSTYAACTATGFYVDGNNMTAALINPSSITSPLDATGCNIGVYFDDAAPSGANANNVEIFGATYFGVLVNGATGTQALNVDVKNSNIHDIGENPHNGTQHGNAIFYINGATTGGSSVDDSRNCGGATTTTGTISGNSVTAYQKNGITAKCPGVSVQITDNTVTGDGAVDFIAQNGIEVGVGALATVWENTVSENEYTGTNNADSSGIIIFGGGPFGALASNETVTGNVLTDNDVGIFSVNCGDPNCVIAPSTDTNNLIQSNTLSNADISNVSGCNSPQGYQAAISELGRNDKINQNKFSGAGYTPNGVPCTGIGTTPAIFTVDRSARQGPKP